MVTWRLITQANEILAPRHKCVTEKVTKRFFHFCFSNNYWRTYRVPVLIISRKYSYHTENSKGCSHQFYMNSKQKY